MPQTPANKRFANLSDEAFANKLCVLMGQGMAVPSLFATTASLTVLENPVAAGLALCGMFNSILLYYAGRSRVGNRRAVWHLGVYGVLGAGFYAIVPIGVITWPMPGLLVLVAALIHGQRASTRLTVWLIFLHWVATAMRANTLDMLPVEVLLSALVPPIMLGVLGAVIHLILQRNELRQSALNLRIREVDAVLPAFQQIALGDLSQVVSGEGDLADATRKMQDDLASLTSELADPVRVLQAIAGVVDRTALGQISRTEGLVRAAAGMQAARQELLEQAHQAAASANDVAAAASQSRAATLQAQESLAALAKTTARVSELHAAIKRVGTKSEVLAVNAAIEAVHAGEAGRSFTVVAARMLLLSEVVGEELATAEALNIELAAAAQLALVASDRAALASKRSQGSANEIAAHVAKQLSHTEHFGDAINKIESFADRLREDTSQAREHAARVVSVADQLSEQMNHFRT